MNGSKVQENRELAVNYLKEYISGEYELTAKEVATLRLHSSRYEGRLIYECIDIAITRYLPDNPSDWSYSNAISKLGGILYNKTRDED